MVDSNFELRNQSEWIWHQGRPFTSSQIRLSALHKSQFVFSQIQLQSRSFSRPYFDLEQGSGPLAGALVNAWLAAERKDLYLGRNMICIRAEIWFVLGRKYDLCSGGNIICNQVEIWAKLGVIANWGTNGAGLLKEGRLTAECFAIRSVLCIVDMLCIL